MVLYDRITRLRAPLTAGPYGNKERDWTAASQATFRVQWSTQAVSEVVGDEPQTVTRAKIFGDPDLGLEAADRVIGPDGATYEVDGDVLHSYRRGRLHHVRAFLRRVDITGA